MWIPDEQRQCNHRWGCVSGLPVERQPIPRFTEIETSHGKFITDLHANDKTAASSDTVDLLPQYFPRVVWWLVVLWAGSCRRHW